MTSARTMTMTGRPRRATTAREITTPRDLAIARRYCFGPALSARQRERERDGARHAGLEELRHTTHEIRIQERRAGVFHIREVVHGHEAAQSNALGLEDWLLE